MRRPRGPGGRFLTAEEIAAQRSPTGDEPGPSAVVPDNDDDMDDDDPDTIQPIPMQPESFIHSESMAMMNMAYRDIPMQLSPQQHQEQQQQQHQHHLHQPHLHQPHMHQHPPALFSQHSHGPNTITLSSPYAAPMQMHHVPHPHAHARHRHLTFPQDMYNSNSDAEMQRRTEEMIQFTAGPSGS
jgi:nuclear transcription factor Y alpha